MGLMDTYSIYGIVFFLAFLGSYIAEYLGQSTILGYIIIGMIIGPFIDLRPYGIPYNGLITTPSTLQIFGNMGLIFIFFFIGLSFTVNKLSHNRNAAIIIALMDMFINMMVGIAIGFLFHWPILDTLFLASIISLSSAVITVKVLEDLKRINTPETGLILSIMIVEDFMSVILLILLSSTYVGIATTEYIAFIEIVGIFTLIMFYIILTFVFIPAIRVRIMKRASDEVVVLLVVGIIMLSSSLASFFEISPIIGAFFIGMTLSETNLSKTVENKIKPIGYLFVSIFFIYVGTLINPIYIFKILPIIMVSFISIIIIDVFIISAITYLLGFGSKVAMATGTSLLPRSEESIVFASFATTIKNGDNKPLLTHSGDMYPLAGIITLFTTLLTPLLIKYSGKINTFMERILPAHMKVSGNAISRVLRGMINSSPYMRKVERHYLLIPFIINVLYVIMFGLFIKMLIPLYVIIILFPVIVIIDYMITGSVLDGTIYPFTYSGLSIQKHDRYLKSLITGVITAISMIIFIPITFFIDNIPLFLLLNLAIFAIIEIHLYLYYSQSPANI